MKCADVWYKEVPDEVRMLENVEIWWHRSVKTTQKMECNCPDVTVVDRAAQEWMFAIFSMPWDRNMETKEDDKITN